MPPQIALFLTTFLASKWGKLGVGLLGTVASLTWIIPLLSGAPPWISKDASIVILGAAWVLAHALPSSFAKVNAAAVVRQDLKEVQKSAPPLAVFCLALLACLAIGCISSAPIVPQTPENANQIATCQSTASFHNDVVIGDFVLSGSVAGVSAAAAGLASPTAKTDLSAVAIGLGAADVIGTAIAAYTASNFANSGCAAVVGPLPALPAKPKAVDPPVQVTIVKTGGNP